MPWTASRPAPQKSIVLRLDGASLHQYFVFPERGVVKRPNSVESAIHTTYFLLCEGGSAPDRMSKPFVESFGNRMSKKCSVWLFLFHSSHSHLTGRDDLQRSQGNLEVGSVALEVEQSLSNVLLKLGGVLPRGAVGGDLVDGAHLGCGCSTVGWDELIVIVAGRKIEGLWYGKLWRTWKMGSLNWGFRALCSRLCACKGLAGCLGLRR